MSALVLYRGSPQREFTPTYGLGSDRQDYGRGFYLTADAELAREWSVCTPDEHVGWVHEYRLDMDGLMVLDLQEHGILAWLAELMKHRDTSDTRRYRVLAARFIARYGIDTDGFDVISGWRANASCFYIAKEFVRDNIDVSIREELLSRGGPGIQYCLKTERACNHLTEVKEGLRKVDYAEFNMKYNERDAAARRRMHELVDSDANAVTNVFSTLVESGE